MLDIRVSTTKMTMDPVVERANESISDKGFKFTLLSNLNKEEFKLKLKGMIEDISETGDKIATHMDVKDMRVYREKIKGFLNEVLTNSHGFSRENFLDSRGRHRVYGIIRLLDKELDGLTKELIKEEKNHIDILNRVGEIKGLLLDMTI